MPAVCFQRHLLLFPHHHASLLQAPTSLHSLALHGPAAGRRRPGAGRGQVSSPEAAARVARRARRHLGGLLARRQRRTPGARHHCRRAPQHPACGLQLHGVSGGQGADRGPQARRERARAAGLESQLRGRPALRPSCHQRPVVGRRRGALDRRLSHLPRQVHGDRRPQRADRQLQLQRVRRALQRRERACRVERPGAGQRLRSQLGRQLAAWARGRAAVLSAPRVGSPTRPRGVKEIWGGPAFPWERTQALRRLDAGELSAGPILKHPAPAALSKTSSGA
ncbi:hypothetical protein THIX_10645 [Thiomonas sp. X19]|nr:hypothetical protein THIX_10645 [Thiomonas sp. X19]